MIIPESIAADLRLLVKLGSIAVHVDEYLGPHGRAIDLDPIRGLLADPEVRDWLDEMDKLSLVPKQRGAQNQEHSPAKRRDIRTSEEEMCDWNQHVAETWLADDEPCPASMPEVSDV